MPKTHQPTNPGLVKVRVSLEITIRTEPTDWTPVAQLADGSQVLELSAYRAARAARAA